MVKVFFSQPFHGRSEEEIFEKRRKTLEFLIELLDHPSDITIIDQYHQEIPEDVKTHLGDKANVWYLSQDLLMMAEADLVVFDNDWESSIGCFIEMKTCRKYGFKYLVLPKL